MAATYEYTVLIYWQDVREAIEMLRNAAEGDYHFRPIGNRVMVDCAAALDAEKLRAAFPGCRMAPKPLS